MLVNKIYQYWQEFIGNSCSNEETLHLNGSIKSAESIRADSIQSARILCSEQACQNEGIQVVNAKAVLHGRTGIIFTVYAENASHLPTMFGTVCYNYPNRFSKSISISESVSET